VKVWLTSGMGVAKIPEGRGYISGHMWLRLWNSQ